MSTEPAEKSSFSRCATGLAAIAAIALLAAGCGRDEPDLANGKQLFTQAQCASCHTLARAGAKGQIGPNLDEAFATARRNGLGETTVRGVVRSFIAEGRQADRPPELNMPPNLVTGQDAEDVSAYVAAVAGVPGEDQGALARAGAPQVSQEPVVAKGGDLTIDADPNGALSFTAIKAEAKPGAVTLTMANPSSVQHNIAVKNDSIDEKGPVVGTGGTSEVMTELEAGSYTFYCSVQGHEEGGMKGELTVK